VKISFLFVYFFSFISHASIRPPAYFVLGKEEFSGVQVYDVIQDNDLNYWFSTNEGLIFYNHYSYQKIECTESKSISFFNFVINQNGLIFCNNLNNQIFCIQGKNCLLIYELRDDEKRNDVSLTTTPENELLIAGRKLILLDEKGNVLERFSMNAGYLGAPYTAKNQQIIYSASNADSVIVYEKGKISLIPLIYKTENHDKGNSVLHFFSIKNQSFAINLTSKSLYKFDEQTFSLMGIKSHELLKRSGSIRMYSTGDLLWAAGTLPGVVLFENTKFPEQANLFYQDYFISDIYQDQEGNILLSTFDKGVLVITDINLLDLITDFKNDPITSLQTKTNSGFIAGTSKGQLIDYDFQNFKPLSQNGTRPIEVIRTNERGNLIIFDDGYIRCYNTETKQFVDLLSESLKDAVFTNNQTAYLSTNSGLTKLVFDSTNFKTFHVKRIPEMQVRNYAVEFDPNRSLLYISNANGVFYMDTLEKIQEIIYKNEPLFASILCYDNGLIYAPQKNAELLVMNDGTILESIKLELEKTSTRIFKIVLSNQSIFASTSDGIYEFDKKGKFKRHFNSTYGTNHGRVLDFEIIKNTLWISNSEGLQTINLNYKGKPALIPLISISAIYANDVQISNNTQQDYNTAIRKFKFVLSSPTLKYKSEINYHYQLRGYDEDWIINDYNQNEILYNALAPGDYEFIVKAENQNKFSKPVSYKFSIAYPFYATWWFIALLIISFLIIVVMIYRWQLNATRQKARQINELNASKLTAIQSQMNPHFIFNSLNSIQDLILKGDVEHSYSYIATFSNLVRRTLSYSDKDFIDFEQELKLLELYLSLEKLRFKKDFSFNIITNDITDIQIPPMLIQPFIENALVHGLLHKEGEKKLTITFTLNHHLICVVEDNGIGREQAKAIKLRQRSDHESFSVQAIRKRFEILSEHFKGELGYTYSDLIENGKAVGTRVTIQLPIKRKF